MASPTNDIQLNPIGIIHSPYKQRGDAPRQGRASETISEIEVFEQYSDGLLKADKASHLIVLYWGDRSNRKVLQSGTPFSETPVGVFATRSPNRPNPIAFCVAEILKIEGNRLTVRGVDALDGSPLLDIKVYSAQVDCVPGAKNAHIPPASKEDLANPHGK
jgi:tRNA-Thr(GGU) m(6)t(6)A37 methyltransferase TsaA